MLSYFSNLDLVLHRMGQNPTDCHPTLPRSDKFKMLSLGGGAISIEEAVFLAGLIWITKPDVVIELGTSQGASALAMGAVLKDVGVGKLITVDLAKTAPTIAHGIAKDMELPIEWVTQTNSLRWLSTFAPNKKLQYLVFSDTDIPVRPEEVGMVQRIFPPGTVIAIHDTSDLHPGGPMNIAAKVHGHFVELPSPRGMTVTKT